MINIFMFSMMLIRCSTFHFFSLVTLRNEHQRLQNDVEAVVAGLNSSLEGVGFTNININFNNQRNMVNMVVDSDSENESIEDINLKEV